MVAASDIIGNFTSRRENERSAQLGMFYRYAGFNSDGVTYIPLDDDERTIKLLRAAYCPYFRGLGYHSPTPIEGVRMAPIQASNVISYNDSWQRYKIDVMKARVAVSTVLRGGMTAKEIGSGFRGTVGDKVTVNVKFTGCFVAHSKSEFGDFHVLMFEDFDGYKYMWMQRNYSCDLAKRFFKSDESYVVVGKVRKHETIKARKFTTLTRCEVCNADGLSLLAFSEKERNEKKA